MKTVLVPMVIFPEQCKQAIGYLEDSGCTLLLNRYGLPFDLTRFEDHYNDIEAVICGSEPWTEKDLQRLPNLKILARFGVGTDNIDLAAAAKRGIVCTNTPGSNTGSVAEFAFASVLSLMKGIPQSNRLLKNGIWRKHSGLELQKKTVGLIGFGAIAQKLTELLRPFGCRLLAYDPYADQQAAKDLGVTLCPFERVLREADVISLHAPLTDETRHCIGQKELRWMRKNAFIVNTARGGLIDEKALYHALVKRQISGAALDVFETEPVSAENPLLLLDNVVCTPHIAGMTEEASDRTGMLAAQAVLDVFAGREPVNRVS